MKEKRGFFKKLKNGLNKTRNQLTGRIEDLIKYYKEIDEEFYEELEEVLITADVGVKTTMEIVEYIKTRVKKEKTGNSEAIKDMVRNKITEILSANHTPLYLDKKTIILVIGVNGVGKTTTIGKLAAKFKGDGKSVILAAGDTFRAAAAEQLEIWGDRTDIDVIRHEEGSDSGAVIYDAINSAKSRDIEVVLCDTAGRLHNKKNLMNELSKVKRIIDREANDFDKRVFLVLDATTGQNALSQAKLFDEAVGVDGLIMTKLDGTAKGGIIAAVKAELKIPVYYIGVGEGVDDLQTFEPEEFAEALF